MHISEEMHDRITEWNQIPLRPNMTEQHGHEMVGY